jgi:hypothetical protein
MSYKKSFRRFKAFKEFLELASTKDEINDFFLGSRHLSFEEAENIKERRYEIGLGELIEELKAKGKTAGARYIAARIWSGADPVNMDDMIKDWRVRKSIIRELSKDELEAIDATPRRLIDIGIKTSWQARRFYELYLQSQVKHRSWGSPYQVCHETVKAIAFDRRLDKLPDWVKVRMVKQNFIPDKERPGNIWRLCDCARAWRQAPSLPKGIAEKVGRLSLRSRILSHFAWENVLEQNQLRIDHGENNLSRADINRVFWEKLSQLQRGILPDLLLEIFKGTREGEYISWKKYHSLRNLFSEFYGISLPYKVKDLKNFLSSYLRLQITPKNFCKLLLGNAGDKTFELFNLLQDSYTLNDRKLWASFLCYGNADQIQKILSAPNVVPFASETVEFLRSLPVGARVRMVTKTSYRNRGMEFEVDETLVRDVGLLWNSIHPKPDLGRVRCWFSVHEQLSRICNRKLTEDRFLPVDEKWEKIDGLSSVDGSWEIEIPRSTNRLKYYGEFLKNCVGGYESSIRSNESIVFVVKEKGLITHCVEVDPKTLSYKQFLGPRNSPANTEIKNSVQAALDQAFNSRKYIAPPDLLKALPYLDFLIDSSGNRSLLLPENLKINSFDTSDFGGGRILHFSRLPSQETIFTACKYSQTPWQVYFEDFLTGVEFESICRVSKQIKEQLDSLDLENKHQRKLKS